MRASVAMERIIQGFRARATSPGGFSARAATGGARLADGRVAGHAALPAAVRIPVPLLVDDLDLHRRETTRRSNGIRPDQEYRRCRVRDPRALLDVRRGRLRLPAR